jgi:multiple sugar transport system permease protein
MIYRPTFAAWMMLAPYIGGTIVLILIPALLTFALAFTDYDALSPPTWSGIQNFVAAFHDRIFHIAVQNSFIFVVTAVPLRILGALALALFLEERRHGVGAYRVSVFLPTVVPDVAYALIWLWIFNPLYGPLNLLLASFGITGAAWLVNPDTALGAIVFMSLFQIGEGFVLLLAALRHIPQDYYDAAAIDGASRIGRFQHVTLPLIAPWLLLLFARDIVITLQSSFTAAYLMTGGGPYYATFLMPLMIYEEAFDRFRFGFASAMMLATFIVICALLLIVNRVLERWLHVDV